MNSEKEAWRRAMREAAAERFRVSSDLGAKPPPAPSKPAPLPPEAPMREIIREEVARQREAGVVPWLAARGVCPSCDRRREQGLEKMRRLRERQREE